MKRLAIFVLSLLIFVVGSANAESAEDTLMSLYAEGELLMVQGKYMEAATKFEALGTYSDSSQMAMYCKAIAVAEGGNMFSTAVATFIELGDFKDCPQMVIYYNAREKQYEGTVDIGKVTDKELKTATTLHQEAIVLYETVLLFKDSMTRIAACSDYIASIETEQNRRQQAATHAVYQEACQLEISGEYQKAAELFDSISDYLDSKQRSEECTNSHLYYTACSYMDTQEYIKAARVFINLRGYKNVNEMIRENAELYAAIKYEEQFLVGRYITLGEYKQTMSEDSTAISWLIVERNGNRALLLSQYALGITTDEKVDDWLASFRDEAFSIEERYAICYTKPSYTKNPEFGTNSLYGDDGPLFLLSCEEVTRYFASVPGMTCVPTEYAHHCCSSDNWLAAYEYAWMLRTEGANWAYTNTYCYYSDGMNYINYTGAPKSYLFDELFIRPAMWVNLDSEVFAPTALSPIG